MPSDPANAVEVEPPSGPETPLPGITFPVVPPHAELGLTLPFGDMHLRDLIDGFDLDPGPDLDVDPDMDRVYLFRDDERGFGTLYPTAGGDDQASGWPP